LSTGASSARVGADEQDHLGFFDAGDGGVQQPALARPVAQDHAVLAAVQAGDAQAAEQVERGLHGFRVLQVAGDDADALGLGGFQLRGDEASASAQLAGRSLPASRI
jgi:hypothetical protein